MQCIVILYSYHYGWAASAVIDFSLHIDFMALASCKTGFNRLQILVQNL